MGPKSTKSVIGWREWVVIPEFGDDPVKAKVDTGARTSALHAFGLTLEESEGATVAHFEYHPLQRSGEGRAMVSREVVGFRKVRSSNGRTEIRPVIRTEVVVGALAWPIDITLTSRDTMGFRMLLGRAAIKGRFLVDPGRSYLQGPR
ncbi:MAG: RimK/LysX family protein [Microthrixaceae bacterium]|nr:ATP-dependent zinc protease [Microthrixaceae bacterium]